MADYPGYGEGMSGGGIMSVLEPFGNYLTEQIDTQRVDPFLETVSNAAYQEFGIEPGQGGGNGFFSGGFYKDGGGGMPQPDQGFDFSNPFPNMPPPLPAVQNPGADNSGAYKVDLISNDHVGDGLFGGITNFGPNVGNDLRYPTDPNAGIYVSTPGFSGDPMKQQPLPMQLPGPRIPTYTKGFDDPITPGGPTVGMGLAPSQGDPVMLAYQDAVESAQEQRKNGFMGRVMLPGEMGFDRFAEGYNYRLNNPNLQSLATVGNDGFGSVSQGPLDFTDGSNIAQPALGGVTLRPTPGAMPVEAFMGGSSTFDESAQLPINMQFARTQFG